MLSASERGLQLTSTSSPNRTKLQSGRTIEAACFAVLLGVVSPLGTERPQRVFDFNASHRRRGWFIEGDIAGAGGEPGDVAAFHDGDTDEIRGRGRIAK